MKNYLKKINKNKYLFWGCITMIIFIIWYLTSKTPIYADDYNYKFIWGTNIRVESISDVLISQYNHYFQWGGRSVAHTLVQIFLFLNKNVFNLFNAIIFGGLVLLIYCISSGKRIKENYNVLNILIIFLILWNCIPVFGECVLWLTGSINYLWTTTIILIFILPYRFYFNGQENLTDTYLNMINMVIIGVLAGWSNENSSVATIFFITLIILYKKNKGDKLPKWCYSGLIGALIGFIIMVIAPGNFARASIDKLNIIQRGIVYIDSLERNILSYGKLFFVLLLIESIVVLIKKFSYEKNNLEDDVFKVIVILSAIVCMGAMIVSPYFPERSLFGFSIFIIIAINIQLCNITKNLSKILINLFSVLVIIILGIFFSISLGRSIIKVNNLENKMNERYKSIFNQINDGKKDILLKEIDINSNQHIAFVELSEDIYDWKNKSMSKYFNVSSIRIEKDAE
ncbi:MAG: DUF6056 family protein [Clostridium celatum]|nr:DUF6056 family protein [Clostridium celatum]